MLKRAGWLRLAAWVVFAAASLAAPALAQPGAGSVYLAGGIVFPHQDGPSGDWSGVYVTAPGGTTAGWSIGGGVFVAPAVSLDVDVASTGLMKSRESSRYDMVFSEERRDRFVALAARVHWPRQGVFQLEPVVGAVLTLPEARSQMTRYVLPGTPQQQIITEPTTTYDLDPHIGVTFGCDVRLGGRHVAVLPSMRVSKTAITHGTPGPGAAHFDIEPIYPGGYPRWTVRPGVALRLDF